MSGMQRWYNIHKFINIIHNINKIKETNNMFISIDAEKAFDKIQHLFIIKAQQSGNRGSIPKHNKGHIWETYQYYIHGAKTKTFPLRSLTKKGCLLAPLLFNIVLEFQATATRQRRNKSIHIGGEEVKLSLFTNDIIVYIYKNLTVNEGEDGSEIGGSRIHFPSAPVKHLADLRNRANSQWYSSIYKDRRPKIGAHWKIWQ